MSIPHLRRRSTCRIVTRLALIVGFAGVIGGTVGGSVPALADPCPTSNPPNELTLVGGSPQTAKLHQPFEEPFQVALANTNGCPVTSNETGVTVTFTAPSSGATGTFSASGSNTVAVGTNASGQASASGFTASSMAGSYTLTASSAYGSISFSLTNTVSGVAATITPGTPASQSASVGSRYAQPLQATVLDANGSPIDGATVTFTLGTTSGGGAGVSTAAASFGGGGSQATELTNTSGTATSPLFSANTTAGTFTATATTAGVIEPVSFTLDNLAGIPPEINALAPTKQSATVGAHYNKPLQVKVLDGGGNPLQGATVTFTLGATGGSAGSTSAAGASFLGGSGQATETTNAAGIAISPRVAANTTAGAFTATATTAGTTKTASFALHNLPAKPTTVTAGVAASESAPVGTRFPVRFAVTVSDKYDNPVAGVTVSFSAPTHGASGHFNGKKRTVNVKTDAKGVAIAPVFVANCTQGGYIVRARAAAHSAAFALINQPTR